MPDYRDFFKRPTPGLTRAHRRDLAELVDGREELIAKLDDLARHHQCQVEEGEIELWVNRQVDQADAKALKRVALEYRRFALDVVSPSSHIVQRLANAGLSESQILSEADAIDAAANRLHSRSLKPRGRKPTRRDWLAQQVRDALVDAGIESSKSADSLLAAVLRIVYEAAEIGQPEDLYRDVASVMPERRRHPDTRAPRRVRRAQKRPLRNSTKKSPRI